MNDKEKILKASKLLHEMGDLYKEVYDSYDLEITKENQDKFMALMGKIFLKTSEVQALDLDL